MNPPRLRRVCGAVLVALAIALSACGSSDKDTYKKDAKAILEPVRQTFTSLGAKINGAGTQQQKLAEVDSARKQLDDAVNKLHDLDPPSGIQKQHDDFVNSLHALSTDMAQLETAAKANDRSKAQAAATKIQSDAPRVQETSDALQKKLDE
jgi:hypothetical protein